MSFFSWLLIPLTASASLNPSPHQASKVPLLGEESSYTADYPVSDGNMLISSTEPQSAPSDEILTLLQQYFPANWQKMYEIAKHESGLNPKAYNPESHETCKGSYGLLQVACSNYDGDPKALFDLETNIRTARQVYDAQGYKAWGVCTNGEVDCGIINGVKS